MSYRLQRTGEKTWTVLQEVTHSKDVIEFRIIARLVAADDAWYIERPVWQDVGHYFERIPRPFVTHKSAIKYACKPSTRSTRS